MTDGRVRDRLDDGADRAAGSRVGGLLARFGKLIAMLVILVPRGVGLLIRQARGTRRNLGRGWDYLTFDNMLPPSIVGTIQWFVETTPKLFGLRDTKPWQQVGAALSLIGFALLATFLSGGWLIGTVVIVAALGSFGVVRFVPAVNDQWREWRAALPIKDDYDLARWRRD